ncbi:MAG TPA: hypothetical protein VFW44_11825 [Bryobacteraceae bacterium]|nr:hypothetical protein [Bryobacteraceae bacterium]
MTVPIRWLLPVAGLSLVFFVAPPSFAKVVDGLNRSNASLTFAPQGMAFSEDIAGSSVKDSSNSLNAPNPKCGHLAVGQTCTLQVPSLANPIVLTYLGSGMYSTTVSGRALSFDAGPSATKSVLKADLENLFNQGPAPNSNLARSVAVAAPSNNATPEPRFVVFMVLAALLAGMGATRLRKQGFRKQDV